MTHRCRVQARVLPLDHAAVDRLMIFEPLPQLEHDRFLVPLAIAIDVIGIQAGRGQCAIPASKEARLKRRECRLSQLIAPLGDRGPMQILPIALAVFNQLDDRALGPARPARDFTVVDARLLNRAAI